MDEVPPTVTTTTVTPAQPNVVIVPVGHISLPKKIFLAFVDIFTSKKLWMSAISISVLYFLYWQSILYLYSFQEGYKVSAFNSMYQTLMYGVTAIVLGYLGIQGVVDMKRNVTDVAQTIAANVFTKSEEKIDITEHKDPKDFDSDDIP